MTNYLVRQYRPAYSSGFKNAVFKGVPRDRLTDVPFCNNFKRPGFKEFMVSDYDGELIIVAMYDGDEHWVVGFALPEDSDLPSNNGDLMRDNWRYAGAVEFK